jgi:hypothetical protein
LVFIAGPRRRFSFAAPPLSTHPADPGFED